MNGRYSFVKVIGLVFVISIYSMFANADTNAKQVIVDFVDHTFESWDEEVFDGKTSYSVADLDGARVLSAKTSASASALYKRMDIDLTKTPYLNWSWRVDNVYPIDNPEIKRGDDYPARIYVVIKEGIFPWQTKALNYVWCNQTTDKPFWPNPFTSSAIMIPVECGDDKLEQWLDERVNIAEDFYRVFNRRIDSADGIAIMSDSDNAGGSAQAYYGGIYFSD
jgi:hypothetical protein